MTALDYVLRQRRLDRCLFETLRARCQRLGALSVTNRTLRRIIHVLAAAELAKTAGSAVPVAGQVQAVAGEAALEALRVSARAIARSQDLILSSGIAVDLRLMRCGLPRAFEPRLPLSRPFSTEAGLARVPSPLAWDASPGSAGFDVLAWDLKTRSFGRCAPAKGGKELDGELYEVRLDREARPPLKPFSF